MELDVTELGAASGEAFLFQHWWWNRILFQHEWKNWFLFQHRWWNRILFQHEWKDWFLFQHDCWNGLWFSNRKLKLRLCESWVFICHVNWRLETVGQYQIGWSAPACARSHFLSLGGSVGAGDRWSQNKVSCSWCPIPSVVWPDWPELPRLAGTSTIL